MMQAPVPQTPWIFLIVLAGALAAGVVLAAVLLGNRHTRGVTKAIGLFLLLVVVAIVGFRISATPRRVEIANVATQHQQAVMDAQAAHFEQLARNFEQHTGEGSQQLVEQYRNQAAQFRANAVQMQNHHATNDANGSYSRGSIRLGIISPVVLLVFVAVVFMAFKHGGPALGVVTMLVPLGLLFFSFVSFQRSNSQWQSRPSVVTSYSDDAALLSSIQQSTDPVPNLGQPDTAKAASSSPVVAEVDDAQAFSVISTSASEASESVEVDSSNDPIAGPPPTPTAEKPEWVNHPPKSVRNVYRRVVESGWYHPSESVQERSDPKVEAVVHSYLQDLANEDYQARSYVPPLNRLGITQRYLREKVVADEYYEYRNFDHADNMVNLHLLVEIDSQTTDDLRGRWRSYARKQNVQVIAVFMGGILASLAGALGLIKLDTHTKGYYTKRLFIGVPAAIIGLLLLLTLI